MFSLCFGGDKNRNHKSVWLKPKNQKTQEEAKCKWNSHTMKRYWNIDSMRRTILRLNVGCCVRVWASGGYSSAPLPRTILFILRRHYLDAVVSEPFPSYCERIEWNCVGWWCAVVTLPAPHKMFHFDIPFCLCSATMCTEISSCALWFAQHCRKMCRIHRILLVA